MGVDGIIVGLGLSPTLLERVEQSDPSGGSLNTLLQIDERFTPTLFVGDTDITRLNVNFEHVIAHEMGHALGLPHVEDKDNLMEQGGDVTCRHWLSEDQIASMGPFSEVVGPSSAEAVASEAFEQIVAARQRILERLLERRRNQRDTPTAK
ncbi:MAG: matrixin family metalloprotease [Polyangiaceae bacterium]